AARAQRAHVVGERLRQHRQTEARKVNAGAAPPRLAIQRRAALDEEADVGDGDVKDERGAGARRFDQYGVVEVLGVLAVDGDVRQLALIAALARRAIDLVQRPLARLFGDALRIGAELVFQTEARDRDRQIVARRKLVAERLFDSDEPGTAIGGVLF